MIQRLCLATARFCSAAWVGAAVLFVVAGISEVRSPRLDSTTKDLLVLLRFPCYYTVGFSLTVASLLAASAAMTAGIHTRTMKITVALLLAALLGMMADYIWIYSSLVEDIRDEGARNARFASLHEASKWINLAIISVTAIAAGLLCWESPGSRIEGPEPE